MTQCDDIAAALAGMPPCEETPFGARLITHCLYPSFEPVSVYVVRIGNGYEVHDAAGAMRSAWDHARDGVAKRALNQHAHANALEVTKDERLLARVQTPDRLLSAIMTVANASAAVAREALESAAQSALYEGKPENEAG